MQYVIFVRSWFISRSSDAFGNRGDTFIKSFFVSFFHRTRTQYEKFSDDRTFAKRERLPRAFPMTGWTDSCHVILFWLILACQRNPVVRKNETREGRRSRKRGRRSRELLLWDETHKCSSMFFLSHEMSLWKRTSRKTLFNFFLLTEHDL